MQKDAKKIIVVGGGAHARVLVAFLSAFSQYEIIGYSDIKESNKMDIPYLGSDELVVLTYKGQNVCIVNGLASTKDTNLRSNVYYNFKRNGFAFVSFVHPSVIISKNVVLDEGVQLFPGVVINPHSVIKENVLINTGSIIEHDSVIGKHSHIAPGCTLSGGVIVGENTHVGIGSTVIQNVEIGSSVTIGAGSVVLKNIADGKMAFGVPAREK